jgi:hypothetical protein
LFGEALRRKSAPKDAALGKYYGATGREGSAPAARASMLYDIENDIIVDAVIEKLICNERGLAKRHIRALSSLEADVRKRGKYLFLTAGIRQKISLSSYRTTR